MRRPGHTYKLATWFMEFLRAALANPDNRPSHVLSRWRVVYEGDGKPTPIAVNPNDMVMLIDHGVEFSR